MKVNSVFGGRPETVETGDPRECYFDSRSKVPLPPPPPLEMCSNDSLSVTKTLGLSESSASFAAGDCCATAVGTEDKASVTKQSKRRMLSSATNCGIEENGKGPMGENEQYCEFVSVSSGTHARG